MAPLVIEGETLGEILHKYNKIVNDAIKNKNVQITEINYDDSDFDNLFKIDIASRNRDVEYILKVLQCTDMLYVSRAIKKSPWLITDKQYAHVINSEYLFNELSPQMTSKAFNKLILQIRLLLRDEERVEDFYNYYKDKDLETAMKWLPHCSQPFIVTILEKHSNDNEVTNHLIKRLCERSMDFLEIYCRHNKQYYKREALFEAMFVMKSDVERYLDIIETMPNDTPTFTAKYTKIIMTKCRDRIMKKLDIYAGYIDVPTFAKFLSEDEVKDFILKNLKNKNLRSLFRDQKIKHLINRLPADARFEFTKKIFINKEHEKDDDDDDDSMLDDAIPYQSAQMCCGRRGNISGTSQNIYAWYIFAPFKTAIIDLKKFIRAEANPNERIAILTVLLTTAGNNMQNIHTLLKYYREHHINEPFKFKIQFINLLLRKTKTYKYDKDTWSYLKDIFTSMEVYSETDKNVQSCVRSVLLYSVINDETVPEIIEKKFEFDTLKQYKKNLSQDEQNKIFNYLFKYTCSKIQDNKLENEKEFEVMFGILENALNLLCNWDKDLKDYPAVLEQIKQLIETKKQNTTWDIKISGLYNKNKSWKKLLFAESLLISPAKDSVMNALKHDPKLIETYKNKIDKLLKDNKNLDMFFKKIRTYWSKSLAKSFKELLLDNLHQNYNHKPFITGLCILLPYKEITEIIKKYVPSEFKIGWNQNDEVQLCIRKYLAMNLYLVRPQPSLDMALLYAKGDYLHYALSSLDALLYNMSTVNICENLKTLLNSPVSLQKHGIRAAVSKLKHEDLKQILSEIWKSIKNIRIRANIFIQKHSMLCKEKNEKLIKEKWELLKMIIDNLTPDEDKRIYITLTKVGKAPMSVRPEYWMKSYKFLNSLSAKIRCCELIDNLMLNMPNIMLHLEDDFIAEIFMKDFDKIYCAQDYPYSHYVATFLLSAKTEEAQMKRYNKIFVPIFEKSIPVWNKQHEGVYRVRNNMYQIIKYLYIFDIVMRDDVVFPIRMFTKILETLQKYLPETENYILITIQKLGLKYITILDKVISEEKQKESESAFKTMEKEDIVNLLHKNVIPEFSIACVKQLKEDIANNFSSIYVAFAEAFNNVLSLYDNNNQVNRLTALKVFLEDKEFIEGYLFALETILVFLYDDKDKAIKNDLLMIICEHPNKEIKMHYSVSYIWKGTRYI